MLPLALFALAGVVVAAVKLTSGPNLAHVALGLKMPLTTIQSAATWARRRKLPLEWVLATILVESRGNPAITGDDGRSIGLMQVNASAHASELAAAGVSRKQLFEPDRNIEWGTLYLAKFKADVLRALGGRSPPIPLDQIVRLSYKGPSPVLQMLKRGGNPAALSWAPEALANWRREMARVSALTHGALRA